jgi:hypothetical protein
VGHITKEEEMLLQKLRKNNAFLCERTSPTTEREENELLSRYIEMVKMNGEITVFTEHIPIDSLMPTHLELVREQIEGLSQIFNKTNYIPKIIVERFGGRYVVLDGHHRCYIAKYHLGKYSIDAFILDSKTQYYTSSIGKTYGELRKEDFILL